MRLLQIHTLILLVFFTSCSQSRETKDTKIDSLMFSNELFDHLDSVILSDDLRNSVLSDTSIKNKNQALADSIILEGWRKMFGDYGIPYKEDSMKNLLINSREKLNKMFDKIEFKDSFSTFPNSSVSKNLTPEERALKTKEILKQLEELKDSIQR